MEIMVERVARALCDGKWDARDFNETANGEEPEEQREYWRDKARAAIEAMKAPTSGMLRAMSRRNDDNDSEEAALANWQAAISTALQEKD